MSTRVNGSATPPRSGYTAIAHRARIHGFEAEGNFEHGTATLSRGGQCWQFTSVTEARRFLDGYELALSTARAPS